MQNSLLASGTAILATLAMASDAAAQGLELQTAPSRWRLNYSDVAILGGEDMGMIGVHFEVLDPFASAPNVFVGLGGFGAISGDRGGFFTGGFSGGWRTHLAGGFHAEVGAFVGGGGGGAAPQGTGFMFRPFAAIEKEFGGLGFRLEVAKTNFPGGDIDDTGLAFGITVPAEMLTGRRATSWDPPIPMKAIDFERWRIGSGLLRILPNSSSRRLDGGAYADKITLGGIQLAAEISETSHIPVKAYGAIEGGIDGFAAVFAGYGISGELLSPKLLWELEALLGMGGGGEVDTGGGLLAGFSGGLRWRLADNWSAHMALGFLDAPNGDFSGETFEVGVAWDPRMLRLRSTYDRSSLASQQLPAHEGIQDIWQASAHYKLYKPKSHVRTKGGGKHESTLHLAGVGFERHISEHTSILVRTAGAVEGDIGGYAESTAGIRASYPPFESLPNCKVQATYEIGAAGGGGVEVGSGLINQASIGWLWSPKPGFELGFDLGRMDAVGNGSFEADVIGFSFAFDIMRIIAAR
jgi:hypothetical protein